MMPDATEIEALLRFTLRRLSDLGVERAVLFSGHFADTQLEMIDRIAADWNATGAKPLLIALSVNRAPVPGHAADHAGLFETTLVDGVAPGLSDMNCLSSEPDTANRFDPRSPLWGIVGSDPRAVSGIRPDKLVAMIGNWLAGEVNNPA